MADHIVVEIGRIKMSTDLDREKNYNHPVDHESKKLLQKWLAGSIPTKYSHSLKGYKEVK
jgi:hypothetical protein